MGSKSSIANLVLKRIDSTEDLPKTDLDIDGTRRSAGDLLNEPRVALRDNGIGYGLRIATIKQVFGDI